ncbi:MAG: hypothetical protein LC792_01980 [Actinobacteria bacterium]|nr:hypothetical protein [Actinomycetota bacterium]
MAQFATLQQLADYLGRPLAELNTAQATLALQAASAAIQAETHQRIEAVVGDIYTQVFTGYTIGNREPVSYDTLLLPELPVTAVASVTVDSVLLDPANYHWTPAGTVQRLDDWFNTLSRQVVVAVTYTHGYAPIPADIVDVTLRNAARRLEQPSGGVSSEAVGNYKVTFAPLGLDLDEDERRSVSNYRLVTTA